MDTQNVLTIIGTRNERLVLPVAGFMVAILTSRDRKLYKRYCDMEYGARMIVTKHSGFPTNPRAASVFVGPNRASGSMREDVMVYAYREIVLPQLFAIHKEGVDVIKLNT